MSGQAQAKRWFAQLFQSLVRRATGVYSAALSTSFLQELPTKSGSSSMSVLVGLLFWRALAPFFVLSRCRLFGTASVGLPALYTAVAGAQREMRMQLPRRTSGSYFQACLILLSQDFTGDVQAPAPCPRFRWCRRVQKYARYCFVRYCRGSVVYHLQHGQVPIRMEHQLHQYVRGSRRCHCYAGLLHRLSTT